MTGSFFIERLVLLIISNAHSGSPSDNVTVICLDILNR